METQKTLNHFQFKHIASNRPVDEKHVDSLVKKIKEKNMLHLFPILVNNRFEVIDGQHRLAAAERLKEYIHYIIDDKVSKADIANVNVLAKNWNLIDFINYWTVEKAPGYDVFTEFMIDNPLIAVSTAMRLMDDGNTTKGLKEGVVKLGQREQAIAIAAYLKELNGFFEYAYQRNFVLALMTCMRTPGYDQELMSQKIQKQPRSLVNCISVKQYIGLLEEIYNHGSSKNRLRFL